MSTGKRSEPEAAGDADVEGTEPDPRDTDHPTGTEQAAENAADESPS
jgi:hypothetical protein